MVFCRQHLAYCYGSVGEGCFKARGVLKQDVGLLFDYEEHLLETQADHL